MDPPDGAFSRDGEGKEKKRQGCRGDVDGLLFTFGFQVVSTMLCSANCC